MVNMCVKYFKQFEGSYTLFEFTGAVKVKKQTKNKHELKNKHYKQT